jgi:hypothetical protein
MRTASVVGASCRLLLLPPPPLLELVLLLLLYQLLFLLLLLFYSPSDVAPVALTLRRWIPIPVLS